MNRIESLIGERNQLADDITYVRAALDDDTTPEDAFNDGVNFCRDGVERLAELDRTIDELQRIDAAATNPRNVTRGTGPEVIVSRDLPDPFDTRDITITTSGGDLRARALTAVEQMVDTPDNVKEGITRTLQNVGAANRGEVALRALIAGSEAYRTGWLKASVGRVDLMDDTERAALARAASLTDNAGGYAVPFTLDPTVILTNDGVNNPVRMLARVVQITTDTWNGVSSAGVTASWDAEGAEVSDDAPTLAQPSITAHKAQAFVPFSVEIGGDWANMEAEIRTLFSDARDRLEGAAHVSGSGSGQPFGIATALDGTAYELAPATAETFALTDIDTTIKGLGARYRNSRTATMAHFATMREIARLLAAANDRSTFNEATAGIPATLHGYPFYENSSMRSFDSFNAAATADNFLMISGDFSNYVIADRVGMNVELVPHLFHTGNNRPSGQRGLWAWWRTGADSVNDAAFRMLSIPTAS